MLLSYIRRKLLETESVRNSDRPMDSYIENKLENDARHLSLNAQLHKSYSSESITVGEDALLYNLGYKDSNELRETIFDILRRIRDPEKPSTLEDLNVIYEDGIMIMQPTKSKVSVIRIEFNPTVPHCSLATLIGLCIRIKLQRSLSHNIKLDIYIKKGAHNTEDEINKQINDKERIAAAMENPNLKEMVEKCIRDEE